MDLRVVFMLFLVALLGVISALLLLPLLQYIVAAALLAFVLFPVHDRLAARTVEIRGRTLTISPRISAGVVTLFGVVATVLPLLLVSIIVLQTVLSFLEEFDDLAIAETVQETVYGLGIDDATVDEIEQFLSAEVEGFLEQGIEFVLQELVGLLDTSFRVGLGILVLVFLLYYFLVDGRRLVGWMGAVAPIEDETRTELVAEIEGVTWAVLISHVLVALAEGVLGGIGLYLLGVPNVAFWSVVMVVVSFLPAIGIWLVWLPIVGYLLFVGDPVGALLLLAYGVTVLSIVDNYLRAFLVDIGSGVHPGTVLVGVIGGLYLFGFLGLILGPVLLAMLKVVLEVFSETHTADTGERNAPWD
ncbi:AI-2E family transporter [Natronococcus sp. A-GB1]|uniref:AI-2E family transporter n=1 Tax=Natronococcus sp. A-GB1 TaxID=3037648 RepID=UPI00241CAAB9|nr:AI-2E family transporter [Natronococcus sp. A-GB1]MDG5760293.1 AI-2E family transporter [Natronococcus sp. A-GB1]